MPQLSGMDYTEISGSARMQYDPHDISAQRIFYIAWSDVKEFARVLLGYTTAVGHVPLRTRAQRFPDFDFLYCQHVTVEGVGELGETLNLASYPKAKLTATYRLWNLPLSTEETDDPEEDAPRFIHESYDFGAEFISAPGTNFTFASDASAVDQPVGKLVGTVEMAFQSDWEPELGEANIRATLGRVNNALFFGYAAGKVLFMGAPTRRVVTSEGAPGWSITYRFRARDISWNKIFRGDTSLGNTDGWWELDPHPYESVNFGILF